MIRAYARKDGAGVSRMSLKKVVLSLAFAVSCLGLPTPAMAASVSEDVAVLLESGDEQTAFDRAEAASYLGEAEGHEALAYFYETGILVEANQSVALALYRKAAEAGRAHAQWRLGVMLDEAVGLPDAQPEQAYDWFMAAAQQDYAKAFTSLGVMYATGRGIDLDYSQALDCYIQAAQLGEAHGFYGVGILFALGQGVPQDSIESAAWMMVALAKGDEQAIAALPQILDNVDAAAHDAVARRADAIDKIFGPMPVIG